MGCQPLRIIIGGYHSSRSMIASDHEIVDQQKSKFRQEMNCVVGCKNPLFFASL